MKTTRSLTESKFRRRHPDAQAVISGNDGDRITVTAYGKDWMPIAVAEAPTEGKALYKLSAILLRLNIRKSAAEAGWQDSNLGEVTALQGHHKKLRSAGRDDSQKNLSALSSATHRAQHHGK